VGYQKISGLHLLRKSSNNRVLKGHGFSRAADNAEKMGALAPEGKLKYGQHSVMKQLQNG
jgi:hypothetical protein